MAEPAGAFILQQPEESFRKAMAKFLMAEAAAKRKDIKTHWQGLAHVADMASLGYEGRKDREEREAMQAAGQRAVGRSMAQPGATPPATAAPAAAPPRPPASVPAPARAYTPEEEPDGKRPWSPGNSPDTRRPFPGYAPTIPGASAPATPNLVPGSADTRDAGPLPTAGSTDALPYAPRSPAPGPQSRAGDAPVQASAYAAEGGGGDISPAEEAAIRTIVAEAPSRDPEAMRAVAAVMRNRASGSGGDLQSVVSRPRQFEGYGNRNYQDAAPGTPQFERGRQATIRMLRGEEEDPTGGADHFYSPGGQAALRSREQAAGGPGRAAVPPWARGQEPVGDYGGNRFYRLGSFPGARGGAPPAAPAGDRQQTDAPVRPDGGAGFNPAEDAVWPTPPPPVGGYGAPAPQPMPPPPGAPVPGPGQLGPGQLGPQPAALGGGPGAALPFADPNGGMRGSMGASMPPGMPGNDPNAVSLRPSMDVPMQEPPGPEPGIFGNPPVKDAIWPPPDAAGASAGPVATAQALQASDAPAGRPPLSAPPLPPALRPSPATGGQGGVPGAPTVPPRAGVLAPPDAGGLMSPRPMVAAGAPPPAGAQPATAGQVDPTRYPGMIKAPEGSGVQQFLGAPEARPNASEVPGPVRRPMPDYVRKNIEDMVKVNHPDAVATATRMQAPYLVEHPYEVKEVEGKMYAVHPFTRKTTEIAGGKDKPDLTVDHGTFLARYDPYHKGLIGISSKNLQEQKRQETTGTSVAEAQQALPVAMSSGAQALRQIEELRAHPGRQWATGPGLGQFTPVPGTSAADFVLRHDQLKAGAFLQALQAFKGTGPVSEKEGAKGEAAVSRMSRASSPKEYDAALNDYRDAIKALMDNARARAKAGPPQAGNPIDDARAAIAAGVPADKVRQRLIERGIAPEGL